MLALAQCVDSSLACERTSVSDALRVLHRVFALMNSAATKYGVRVHLDGYIAEAKKARFRVCGSCLVFFGTWASAIGRRFHHGIALAGWSCGARCCSLSRPNCAACNTFPAAAGSPVWAVAWRCRLLVVWSRGCGSPVWAVWRCRFVAGGVWSALCVCVRLDGYIAEAKKARRWFSRSSLSFWTRFGFSCVLKAFQCCCVRCRGLLAILSALPCVSESFCLTWS
jgi:hypothetical protein